MNFIQHTRAAHDQLTRQPAATPFHVSLYWALFFEWNAGRFPESLALDHNHLMRAAHIGSIKTYRATLYDLENWGLLAYQPSKSKYQPSRCFMSDLLGAELPPVKDPTGGTSTPGENQSTQATSAPGTHPAPGPEVSQVAAASGAEVTQVLLINDKRSNKSKPLVEVNGPAAAPQKKMGEASPANEGLSGLVEDSPDDCQPRDSSGAGAAPKKKVAPKKMRVKHLGEGVPAEATRPAATARANEPRRPPPLPEVLFRESAIYDFAAFTAAFAGTDGALTDLRHYHQLIDTWRDKQTGLPPRRKDWVATARRFMLNDAADNRLKLAPGTQPYQPGQPSPDPGTRPAATGYRSKYDA
ncbi:hypothetical protein QMK33_19535 [Hymenobacter sp. H14-R3]|uniref:hypothetical protein n=1 Tax=Hymenobacter sp. H14-R3 TaxID=3046308 RepID=UPI0024B9B4C0|nr:hypothetical protein [Hymenobacter sp. H14-R3]MDJ0367347.1 hypothetical protein [Hymenobacter sp. H14-R3]